MKPGRFFLFAILAAGFANTPHACAWGQLGHGVIGTAALAQVQPRTRIGVAELLGMTPDNGPALAAALDHACSWPDEVRETPEWAWSAPQHYVNIPRHADRYDRQRDCPDGLCVTEALARYVAELARPELSPERRWQAFAWVCHLAGDLHQPLHAGFRDDRGGNLVEIEYRGENWNLHTWWDDVLPAERLDWRPGMALPGWMLLPAPAQPAWRPEQLAGWTEESHALALECAYPPGPVIDASFADASWDLVQARWRLAAARLALILDWIWQETGEPVRN